MNEEIKYLLILFAGAGTLLSSTSFFWGEQNTTNVIQIVMTWIGAPFFGFVQVCFYALGKSMGFHLLWADPHEKDKRILLLGVAFILIFSPLALSR